MAAELRTGRTLGGGDLRAEVHVAQQPFDDKDVSDDGNRPAGDYTQAGAGLRYVVWPEARSSWEIALAAVWFEARGAPNLIDEAEQYLGLRAGLGWRVRVSDRLDLGPELSVLFGESDADTVLFPQFTWGLRWRLGR